MFICSGSSVGRWSEFSGMFSMVSTRVRVLNNCHFAGMAFVRVIVLDLRKPNEVSCLSVLMMHFSRDCIGGCKQLYSPCEERFVRTFDLQKGFSLSICKRDLASRRQSMMALGKRWFGVPKIYKVLARICHLSKSTPLGSELAISRWQSTTL